MPPQVWGNHARQLAAGSVIVKQRIIFPSSGGEAVTLVWFIIWLIANNVGGHEPLLFNPVNAWTGTLILAIALDLATAHARGSGRSRKER